MALRTMESSGMMIGRHLLEGIEIDEKPSVDPSDDTQSRAALAILVLMVLLGLALKIGQLLEWKKVWWMSEAAVALILGILMGWLAKSTGKDETFREWLSFKGNFFYFALLPPIIFEAGYSLNVKPFLSNIGGVCAYAFIGTGMSTILVGFTMYDTVMLGVKYTISITVAWTSIAWAAGAMKLCSSFTFLQCLIFGSIISATDPVTVLAVFQKLDAHPDLYTLVFGESIFNDAVAIVLFSSLKDFYGKTVTPWAIFLGLLTFIEIFVLSMVIGIAYGLIASLLFRGKIFKSEHAPVEGSLVVLLALSSFFTAEGLEKSGIVAILFCGMIMAKYTRPNLSPAAETTSVGFFKILSYMSETFIFIYIGTTLFLHAEAWGDGYAWAFLVMALFAIAHSRFFNVYANTKLVNALRPVEMHIPKSLQFMLWFSGLRGAVAYALALRASTEIFVGEEAHVGRVFLTTTFFIILLTVVINGGATTWLLERLNLRSVAPNYSQLMEDTTDQSPSAASADARSGCGNSPQGFLGKIREMNRVGLSSTLQGLDDRYLSRIFIPPAMELQQTSSGNVEPPPSNLGAAETNEGMSAISEAPGAAPNMNV